VSILFTISRILEKLPNVFQHIYVHLVIIIGWAFFRADTLSDSLGLLSKMFVYSKSDTYTIGYILQNDFLLIGIVSIVLSMPIIPRLNSYIEKLPSKQNIAANFIYLASLFLLLLLSIMQLASGTYNPFIYFRF